MDENQLLALLLLFGDAGVWGARLVGEAQHNSVDAQLSYNL